MQTQIDITQLTVAPSTHWMEAFGAWLHEHDRMEKTITAYMQDMRHFSKFFERENGQVFEPGYLNATDVKKYFARQDADKEVAATSRNRRLASLRVLVEFAVEAGLLEYDPTVSIKRQPIELTPRDRNTDELSRLNEVVRCGSHIRCAGERHAWLALRDRVIWALFMDTGLRIHEVSNLEAADLDFEAGKISVIGKGGKKASINVSSGLLSMLAEWIQLRPGCAALVVDWNGERLTTGQIRRRIKMIGEAAGVQDLNPHDLRHTYAYRLKDSVMQQGLSEEKALDAVRKQLRHGDTKTTLLYFRVRESQIRAAVEVM
jgi:site-specific recombinase XerD